MCRRRDSKQSLTSVRRHLYTTPQRFTTYQPLGPLCSLMARKFKADAMPAALHAGVNCTRGYGWSTACYQ
jgi:hypothetical protein